MKNELEMHKFLLFFPHLITSEYLHLQKEAMFVLSVHYLFPTTHAVIDIVGIRSAPTIIEPTIIFICFHLAIFLSSLVFIVLWNNKCLYHDNIIFLLLCQVVLQNYIFFIIYPHFNCAYCIYHDKIILFFYFFYLIICKTCVILDLN